MTNDYNTGDWNTGNRNTGNCNTGDRNTGNRNTGDCNTGDWNTGDWNTGNWNTGYCNTITNDKILTFNKECLKSDWDEAVKPKWMHVSLTQWINEDEMTSKEKEVYPSYITTGGYLKVYSSLKHAFIDAWDKATQKDRELTLKLPNYDPVVATEIFGFNPSNCVEQKKEYNNVKTDNQKTIIIDGVKYELKEVK